jgi:hypothetical protein
LLVGHISQKHLMDPSTVCHGIHCNNVDRIEYLLHISRKNFLNKPRLASGSDLFSLNLQKEGNTDQRILNLQQSTKCAKTRNDDKLLLFDKFSPKSGSYNNIIDSCGTLCVGKRSRLHFLINTGIFLDLQECSNTEG